MNPLQEIILIGEIVLQSKIALRVADRLQIAYESSDRIEIWSSIQSILIINHIKWITIDFSFEILFEHSLNKRKKHLQISS